MRTKFKKHPGVVLLKPEGTHGWRARYEDPDSGKATKVTLDSALKSAEARNAWAVNKSEELDKRRYELSVGAVRKTNTPFSEALDRYFKAHVHLRETTQSIYRAAADELATWAAENGVETTDDLTRGKLVSFREALISRPRSKPLKRGTRGKRTTTEERRAPISINQDLRSVYTVLHYLIDLDLMARCTTDDLRRALKRLPVVQERIEFLRPADIAKLMKAASNHDNATFKITRKEHRGHGARGSTSRFEPITPFVLLVLLTGMRFTEAAELTWEQVDLDAGEIYLSGATVKTKQARTVDLSVSPALLALLTELKKKRGGQSRVVRQSADELVAARKRLLARFEAPSFDWQTLRRTCGSYLTNAPGIFGAASAYRSAKQLGHSVVVAEKHYLGVVKVPKDATTLEAAMGLRT